MFLFFPPWSQFFWLFLCSLSDRCYLERLRYEPPCWNVFIIQGEENLEIYKEAFIYLFSNPEPWAYSKSCVSIPTLRSTPYPRDIFKTVKWTSSIASSPKLALYADQADLKFHLLPRFPLCWDYWHAIMPSTNLSFDTLIKTCRGLGTVFLSLAEGCRGMFDIFP